MASTLAAGVTVAGASAKDEERLPIVDTHQHLWDLKKVRLPWIEKGSNLDHSFLMSDYLKEAEGLNIVRTIYMEVDLDPAQQDQEAEYVITVCPTEILPIFTNIRCGTSLRVDGMAL